MPMHFFLLSMHMMEYFLISLTVVYYIYEGGIYMEEKDEKKKEVMEKDHFGICYKCGSPMLLLTSTYLLFTVAPHGKFPNGLLQSDKDMTLVCPKCGTKIPMVNTVDGMYPRDYFKVTDKDREVDKKKHNIIGYIDEKKREE